MGCIPKNQAFTKCTLTIFLVFRLAQENEQGLVNVYEKNFSWEKSLTEILYDISNNNL